MVRSKRDMHSDARFKFYITCPFSEKEIAKNKGARWDPEKKRWYAPNADVYEKLSQWYTQKRKKTRHFKQALLFTESLVTTCAVFYPNPRFPNATQHGPHGDTGRPWGKGQSHECCNQEDYDPTFPGATSWGKSGDYGPRWGSNYTGD